jgi:hypothetical protein
MDLQTRKLNVIEYLVGIHDEKVFRKIEDAITEVKKKQTINQSFNPFTREQLIDRAKRSNLNYQSGKFMTQEQLEKESENW